MSEENNKKEQEMPLGLYWKGKRTTVERTVLPFQHLEVVETINESRATREAEKDTMFRKDPDTVDTSWRNKLIWGDNKYAMAALLEKYAGKIDLIYIDPPFATGADFSTSVSIGENEINHTKEASAIEELAYRDTWGKGLDSFLQMMYDRLVLMKELLSDKGVIYVHCDYRVSSHLRLIMDEIFGIDNLLNIITWRRTDPHNNVTKKFGVITDNILFYKKSNQYFIDLTKDKEELSESALKEFSLIKMKNGKIVNYESGIEGERFKLNDATVPNPNPERQFLWRGARPSSKRSWPESIEGMEDGLKTGKYYLRNPNKGAARCKVSYLKDNDGQLPQDIWLKSGTMKGGSDYPTQKPKELLK